MFKIRVYYEDTDCGGVVYYANYLKYFERARTEFLREQELSVAEHMKKNLFFVVARVEIDYKFPAKYDDLLLVETRVGQTARASFFLEHTILNEKSRKIIVEGKVKMACINEKGSPTRIPDDVWRSLKIKDTDNFG